jgi:isoleucyl-tRNA synthetase
VKVRQPLSEAVIHYPGSRDDLSPLLDLVAEELNVKEVMFAGSADQLATWQAKPNFRVLGPRLGPRVKDLAASLAADDGSVASALARGENAIVMLGDEHLELEPGDVDLSQETRSGWGVAAEGGITVALDLEPTRELRLEGMSREVIRLVQDARKAAGLDVSDRILVGLVASGELAEAIALHGGTIAGETLATTLGADPVPGATYSAPGTVEDQEVQLSLRRA